MAIRNLNGGGTGYIKFSRPPIVTADWQGPTNSTPVLNEPLLIPVDGIKFPTGKELEEILSRGVVGPLPIVKIVETKDPVNGGSIKVAIDKSGEVVATKKSTNFIPLAIAGAIVLMILGG